MESYLIPLIIVGVIVIDIISITIFKTKKKKKSFDPIQTWASNKNLSYQEENKKAIIQRMQANPHKRMCETRLYFSWWGSTSGPYIEGRYRDRKIWLYRLRGRPLNQHEFYGYCIEFATHQIPIHIIMAQKKILSLFFNKDDIQTESRMFEGKYMVYVNGDHGTLQLLDPHMIHLLDESNFPIIEFSDSSVAIFLLKQDISSKELDIAISAGIDIAEQVDRNFPLGKYEKK